MHQLGENTAQGWTGVLADLAAKRQGARDSHRPTA